MAKKDAAKEQAILAEIIKNTAPGTFLREGLDQVLLANTGALIVMAEGEKIESLISGGFQINTHFSPAHLYELAKMDGAIVLSKDGHRILNANCHLSPDAAIPSGETGIRHRTAERTAKQTGELVICISHRRRMISLFKGEYKYVLRDIGLLLTMANQAVQTLEKYKTVLDQALLDLSILEYDGAVTLGDVVWVIQRAEMSIRIEEELAKYINELGSDGRLVKMQVEELIYNVETEEKRCIMDYARLAEDAGFEDLIIALRRLTLEELLDVDNLANILGYETPIEKKDQEILTTKGYRILHKVPRLPSTVIHNLVEHFADFVAISLASVDELDEVEGIGAVRAKHISLSLERLRGQIVAEQHWN